MEFLLPLIITFCSAVFMTSLYFITKRSEKDNEDPIKQLTRNLQTTMNKVKALEEKFSPVLENQNLKEEMKLLKEDFSKTQNYLIETRNEISKLVMRLLASYKPISRRKEVDQ